MLLVKFGGSVITDRSRYSTFSEDAARRLVRELKGGNEELEKTILVHGAGSFGHILAYENEIDRGVEGKGDFLHAVPRIRRDVRRLNSKMSEILTEEGFHPISLEPEVVMHKKEAGGYQGSEGGLGAVTTYLDTGFLPVLFGDVVSDEERGFSICSGDDVILMLSHLENVERTVFVTDVPGIFESFEKGGGEDLIDRCPPGELLHRVEKISVGDVRDVTGGMYGKVCKIADIGSRCDVWVIDGRVPGRLEGLLRTGSAVGTFVSTDVDADHR